MSKGISRQQQQILGLAVALARRRHRKGKLVVADDTDGPDITVAFAAVVVGGVALVPQVRSSGEFGRQVLDRSPAGWSARGSIDRAFGSLVQRGLLVPCEPQRFNRRDRNPDHEGRYVLTEAGIAAGLPYETLITDDMRPVLWLLDQSTKFVGFTDRHGHERRAALAHEGGWSHDSHRHHGLPPRTALRTGYARVLVVCNSCRHQADADLQALVDAGRGDVPLTELRFRCSQCGTDRTDFVVTSRDNPQPS